MSINGMKQQQGEKRADFIARCQTAQMAANAAKGPQPHRRIKKYSTKQRPPAWGSQQWAETRGDDLGESPDY